MRARASSASTRRSEGNAGIGVSVHTLYSALVGALAPLDLAYLHLVHAGDDGLLGTLRSLWPGTLMLNRPGAELSTRARDVAEGRADVISVGTLALANPDLVDRIGSSAPLNSPDPATFYGGGASGYTDYPTHGDARGAR